MGRKKNEPVTEDFGQETDHEEAARAMSEQTPDEVVEQFTPQPGDILVNGANGAEVIAPAGKPEKVELAAEDRLEAFKQDVYKAQLKHKVFLRFNGRVVVIDAAGLSRVKRQMFAGSAADAPELSE
jgi:hypothetical protein